MSQAEATEFAKQSGLLFAETSAVTAHNVNHVFNTLLQEIYNAAPSKEQGNEEEIDVANPEKTFSSLLGEFPHQSRRNSLIFFTFWMSIFFCFTMKFLVFLSVFPSFLRNLLGNSIFVPAPAEGYFFKNFQRPWSI